MDLPTYAKVDVPTCSVKATNRHIAFVEAKLSNGNNVQIRKSTFGMAFTRNERLSSDRHFREREKQLHVTN